MTFTLPAKTIRLQIIRAAVATFVAVGVFVFFAAYENGYFIIGAVVCLLIFGFAALFYIPRAVRSYKVCVEKDGITVEHGVFILTKKLMPFTRLVFVQTATTPLSALFGLKTVFFLAEKARITVSGLETADTEMIIEFVRQVKENDTEQGE